MAQRIDVKDLNVYYGAFKAVEGVTMTVEPRSVTAPPRTADRAGQKRLGDALRFALDRSLAGHQCTLK